MDILSPELKRVVDSFIPFQYFHKKKYIYVLKSIVIRGGKFCRGCILTKRKIVLPSTKVYSFKCKNKNTFYRMAECLCNEHLENRRDYEIVVPQGMQKSSISVIEFLTMLGKNIKCVFPEIINCNRTDEYIHFEKEEDYYFLQG